MFSQIKVLPFMISSSWDEVLIDGSVYLIKYQKPNIPAIFFIDLPRSFFYTLDFFSNVDFYNEFSFETVA